MPNNPPKNDTPDKALVERLRSAKANCNFGSTLCARDAHAAADEIERLSQPQHGGLVEADRVVAAFEAFNDAEHNRQDCPECGNEGPWYECAQCSDTVGDLLNAHLLAIQEYKTARADIDARDTAEFGASDAACYLYPGNDQQAERAAFRSGAAHAMMQPALASDSPVVGEGGPPETIDGVETGNTVAPNTPTTADRREAVARLLCNEPLARHIAAQDNAPPFDDSSDEVQAYWRALASAVVPLIAGLPEGMVMVPIEPTRNMCIAAAERTDIPLTQKGAREFYRAMIAAATGDA